MSGGHSGELENVSGANAPFDFYPQGTSTSEMVRQPPLLGFIEDELSWIDAC